MIFLVDKYLDQVKRQEKDATPAQLRFCEVFECQREAYDYVIRRARANLILANVAALNAKSRVKKCERKFK
jgi:glycerol-3-phosphate dehydrogenase